MNPLILAQEIIDGRRITREDDLSFFLTCDFLLKTSWSVCTHRFYPTFSN